MKELSLTDLASILKVKHNLQISGQFLTGISTDSRTVKAGDCFFAIAGENFDGHNFLADAFAKGASCAVVSRDMPADKFPGKTILKVSDTVKALGDLAAWYRKDCNFKVVAITGSVGKTTTRQIAFQALSRRFRAFQSLKNFNNFIGLPLSILAAPADSEILVLELATNKPGEIEYLSRIAAPDIALVTNVQPAHLAGFGSIEKIAEEKLSIAKGLRPGGILIINADCPPLVDYARQLKLSFQTFSCNKLNGVFLNPLSSQFQVDDAIVEIPLPGRGNAENALAAWSISSAMGIKAREFAEAVKTVSVVSMRAEILQIGSLTVISDCYNANPASMKNALDILANLSRSRKCRSVFICGDMAELGDSAQDFHSHLGKQIADAGVQCLVTLGKMAAIAADAAKKQNPNLQTCCFNEPVELCNNLHQFIKDSDIILVKGSRINKLELVVEKLKGFNKIK